MKGCNAVMVFLGANVGWWLAGMCLVFPSHWNLFSCRSPSVPLVLRWTGRHRKALFGPRKKSWALTNKQIRT